MRFKAKAATLLAATALLAGGALTTGAATASAAPTVKLVTPKDTSGYYYLVVDGISRGAGIWQQDPSGSTPGDALAAYDSYADGYGIDAFLSDGRLATTSGHNSPYTSGWVTGNLPEDTAYTLTVCLEKADVDSDCVSATVSS